MANRKSGAPKLPDLMDPKQEMALYCHWFLELLQVEAPRVWRDMLSLLERRQADVEKVRAWREWRPRVGPAEAQKMDLMSTRFPRFGEKQGWFWRRPAEPSDAEIIGWDEGNLPAPALEEFSSTWSLQAPWFLDFVRRLLAGMAGEPDFEWRQASPYRWNPTPWVRPSPPSIHPITGELVGLDRYQDELAAAKKHWGQPKEFSERDMRMFILCHVRGESQQCCATIVGVTDRTVRMTCPKVALALGFAERK